MSDRAVGHKELKPTMCGFDLTWGWYCGERKEIGKRRCLKHSKLTCRCGQKATHLCSETMQFVCGEPLCDHCHH